MIEYLQDRITIDNNECWLWKLSTTNGYARARLGGRMRYVHRVYWELVHGPVPGDHDLDHVCHTNDLSCKGGVTCLHRRCVNLDHLEVVTKKINSQRSRQRDLNWSKTECPKGHPYDDTNTFWYTNAHGNKSRGCKECRRRVRREYYYRVGV